MAQGAIMGQLGANRQLSNLSNTQRALNNIGAGMRPNLFINPFFQVNQRGKTSYSISSPTYTLDGWKTSGTTTSGLVLVKSDSVRVQNSRGSFGFGQLIEDYSALANKTVTVSFLMEIASGLFQLVVEDGSTKTSPPFSVSDGIQLCSYTCQISSSPSQAKFTLENYTASVTANIYAAKLEIGDTQTLAYQDSNGNWNILPQSESDYHTQLLKCQQYFYQINVDSTYDVVLNGIVTNGTKDVVVYAPFLKNFKSIPSVSFQGGVIIRTPQGYAPEATFGSPYTNPIITTNDLTLLFNKQGLSPWNMPGELSNVGVSVNFSQPTTLQFSAEL